VSLKKHIKIAKQNTIITPRLYGWLNQHSDGVKVHDPEIMEKVTRILTGPEKDRSGSFHPSQLYQCPRLQVFEFYGLPGPSKAYNPTLQNLFNDGHFRHLRWQIMLLSAGIISDIEVSIASPEFRLTGSMDGVNREEGWMFELKGTSQYSSVLSKGVMPAHVKQVHAYLHASGLDKAVVVYECKSSQQWTEFEVSKDPEIIAEIEGILTVLNRAIDTDVLPEPLDDCKNRKGAFLRCKYASSCLGFNNASEVRAELPASRRVAEAGTPTSGD